MFGEVQQRVAYQINEFVFDVLVFFAFSRHALCYSCILSALLFHEGGDGVHEVELG
jgi:hypothetical protein